MVRTTVVTFATADFKGSAEGLRHSALRIGGADECIVFDETDVAEFFKKNPRHLAPGSRGYGWWAWKPYLLSQVMKSRKDGDVILYCDAAMIVESSLAPVIDAVKNGPPILLTRLGGWTTNDYSNQRWTKPETFELMGVDIDGPAGSIVQFNAAFQAYRNCVVSRAFMSEYLRWCEEYRAVSDPLVDAHGAKHRHDQSILTILASAMPVESVTIARDVTQHGKHDPTDVNDAIDLGTIVDHHRRKLNLPKIAVITPTVGGKHLRACVESVQRSTTPNVEHWIVTDGPEHHDAVREVLDDFENRHPIVNMVLPRNTGSRGWNGHRIFAALPCLVQCDYVSFLDDDNTVDPDHYQQLLEACVLENKPWAYSLRRIIDQDGAFVCDDNCESLGGIRHTINGPNDWLIDTSCYMMEREIALESAPAWNVRARDPNRTEADRQLAQLLLSNAPHAVVRKHSVNYRLGSTPTSVKRAFFDRGNAVLGYDFERKKDLYVFHFSPKATDEFLRTRRLTDRSYALDEWQMTLLRGLDADYNLIDGYSCAPNIPHGADVFVSLCNPGDAPVEFLAQRPDLHRVVYTVESPNIRHASQWTVEFLTKSFDAVCTYHTPLLEDERVPTVFTPHHTHHGNLDDPKDRVNLLRDNIGFGSSCAMVLERRPQLFGKPTYDIDGRTYTCLDQMREDLVRGLDDVTVFGVNWDAVADGKRIKLGHALHRSADPKSSVDILQDYDFAIIVENCEADGYCSEKLYDALSAGAIPLYVGSVPKELDIPEGFERGVYVDLKKLGIETGDALQRYLSKRSRNEIDGMKKRIVDQRERILRLVDQRSVAECIVKAIDLAHDVKKRSTLTSSTLTSPSLTSSALTSSTS